MSLWALTGGRGSIGRALTARLEADGVRVRLLDGDVRDRRELAALVGGTEVVVHLAAYVHRAARTHAERAECHSVNAGGTAALADAISAHAPGTFLIHLSTANVYAPSEQPLVESSPLGPATPYGLSKLEAERIVLTAYSTRSVHATILRPAMVFGPGAPGNLTRLVSMIRRGVMFEIGGGRNRKSILPIDTLIEAIIAVAANRAAADGEIFNVGGGEPLTMRQIADAIAAGVGRRPRRIALARAPLLVAARVLDAILGIVPLGASSFAQLVESYGSTVVLDDTKLRSRIGFAPRVDLVAAVTKAVGSGARVS